VSAAIVSGQQQRPADAVPDSGAVIRTETRVVLVDTVVTDKKGNYVRNLSAKDFKVWEDNKEQLIKTFTFQSDPAAPTNSQRRYIVHFGGALQIAQNFTDNTDRLKRVVSGEKLSAVSPNEDAAMGQLSKAAADFGAHDMLLSLRSLAKNLSTVPGRKTLILFTGGFPLTAERISETTATIDMC